jgi:hypothetical protein
MGVPADKAANRAAMANVEALDFFTNYAAHQTDFLITPGNSTG